MKNTFLLLPALALPLSAQLRITEVMPDSNHSNKAANGDWFEITNTGATAVDVANYSFDDEDRNAGASSGFPSYNLQPGASMIVLDESSETTFRTLWNLDPSIRIVTGLVSFPGLGAAGDEVNLYNNGGGLVDRYTFGAATEGVSFAKYNNGQSIPGGLSSNGVLGAYESNDPSEDVASPGISSDIPPPLPPFSSRPSKQPSSRVPRSLFRSTAFERLIPTREIPSPCRSPMLRRGFPSKRSREALAWQDSMAPPPPGISAHTHFKSSPPTIPAFLRLKPTVLMCSRP